MANVVHLVQTFLLELRVANGKDFIHHQNFWLEMSSHRKGQSNIHSAAIALHWRVDKLFYSGKRNDLVELSFNFHPSHAEDGAIQEDVFAARQFLMKSRANFEQAGYAATDADASS